LGSARDRRGAEQPRRNAPGPEANPEPRIRQPRSGVVQPFPCSTAPYGADSPVFCGAVAKNAPKVLKKQTPSPCQAAPGPRNPGNLSTLYIAFCGAEKHFSDSLVISLTVIPVLPMTVNPWFICGNKTQTQGVCQGGLRGLDRRFLSVDNP
jgi:hypothetical protein